MLKYELLYSHQTNQAIDIINIILVNKIQYHLSLCMFLENTSKNYMALSNIDAISLTDYNLTLYKNYIEQENQLLCCIFTTRNQYQKLCSKFIYYNLSINKYEILDIQQSYLINNNIIEDQQIIHYHLQQTQQYNLTLSFDYFFHTDQDKYTMIIADLDFQQIQKNLQNHTIGYSNISTVKLTDSKLHIILKVPPNHYIQYINLIKIIQHPDYREKILLLRNINTNNIGNIYNRLLYYLNAKKIYITITFNLIYEVGKIYNFHDNDILIIQITHNIKAHTTDIIALYLDSQYNNYTKIENKLHSLVAPAQREKEVKFQLEYNIIKKQYYIKENITNILYKMQREFPWDLKEE